MNFARLVVRALYRLVRRRAFAVRRQRDEGAVVFAGDSLFAWWGGLARDFPRLKTANRGLAGDRSEELLVRFESDVLSCRPRAVVVLIGTNDLTADIPPERIIDAVRAVLAKVSALGVPVVLCRVPPRAPAPGRFPEMVRALNAGLDGLACPTTTVCDTFSPLADENGDLAAPCSSDGLHLTREGYARIAGALAPALARLVE